MIQVKVQKLPAPKVFTPYRLIVDVLDGYTHERLQMTLGHGPTTDEGLALCKAVYRSQRDA